MPDPDIAMTAEPGVFECVAELRRSGVDDGTIAAALVCAALNMVCPDQWLRLAETVTMAARANEKLAAVRETRGRLKDH